MFAHIGRPEVSTSPPLGVHSLWVRLALLMLLTSLALLLLLMVIYQQTESRFYTEFTRQIAELTQAVQIGLEGASSSIQGDPLSLQEELHRLNPRGIQEVSVINGVSNRIIASSRQENIGNLITRQRQELIFKADAGEPVTGVGQIFNVIVPVVADGRSAGYIQLTLNTADFSSLLRLSAMRRSFAALCVLGLGTFIAIALAQYYARPIVAMAKIAEAVAAGDLEQYLPLQRRDEIGRLAESFQTLIARLREDREVRERLRTAEHLASAGQFARQIAHEIKNPLNFISLSIDHMGDSYRPADAAAAERYDALIRNLKGEVQRIGHFAEQFLEQGRPFTLQLRTDVPQQLLDEVLQLVAEQARRQSVTIESSFAPPVALRADPQFLRTCFYNVVKNALEAMPNGGWLRVGSCSEAGQLKLFIEDTGGGVPPEDLERLFVPLYTTKPGGLGLGLALTRRVIEEHGGTVTFASLPGEGSRVTFALPLTENPTCSC